MPKVSVITPVYNGGQFLAEAIESVLQQSFSDWDYVILDNASTDNTPDIIAEYMARDPRVRYARNNDLLPIIQNWNTSMRLIGRESKYTKVLHADDLLEPNCIERMVALAEQHDNVGIVSSLIGSNGETGIHHDLPAQQEVFTGAEICRRTMLGEIYVFGSPSSILVRSDIVRGRGAHFFNDEFFHADYELCYDILRRWDFGFIQEPLTFTRKHAASQSNTRAARFHTSSVDEVGMMMKHGRFFFSPEEYRRLYTMKMRRYRRLIVRRILMGKGREYAAYHKERLAAYGYQFGKTDMLLGFLSELAGWCAEPSDSMDRFRRHFWPKSQSRLIS